jgi:hypothetical protein
MILKKTNIVALFMLLDDKFIFPKERSILNYIAMKNYGNCKFISPLQHLLHQHMHNLQCCVQQQTLWLHM